MTMYSHDGKDWREDALAGTGAMGLALIALAIAVVGGIALIAWWIS